mgnify:CR=1 FL=1|tara:strand:- start:835 stop:1257 length:423 start_codon:yes stop_codon:yes gene_type:complete
MDPEQTSIKLDVSQWRIRIDKRSKNRMKLQIKLSKDEALAFKNFSDVCKPEDIADDDFIKTVFVTGIEAMNKQLAAMVQKYASENREELAASGITVFDDEDGQIRLAPNDQINNDMSGGPTVKDNVLHDDEIRKYTDEDK